MDWREGNRPEKTGGLPLAVFVGERVRDADFHFVRTGLQGGCDV